MAVWRVMRRAARRTSDGEITDRFYTGRTQAERGEGERRGWRLNGVICMEGNPFRHSAWREAGLARYRGRDNVV